MGRDKMGGTVAPGPVGMFFKRKMAGTIKEVRLPRKTGQYSTNHDRAWVNSPDLTSSNQKGEGGLTTQIAGLKRHETRRVESGEGRNKQKKR